MPPVEFKSFQPIFPPRPRGAIPPERVNEYSGFIAQYKYNDIRTLAYLFPDRKPSERVEFFNRKLEELPLPYTFGIASSLCGLGFDEDRFHVLDGGMLRSRRFSGGNPLYVIWDILVFNGSYLLGTSFDGRYRLLSRLLGSPAGFEKISGNELGLLVRPNLWLAPVFHSDFAERFRSVIHLPEIEGLVLKDPFGRLSRALSQENNGSWQIRVRKPHPNYSF